MVSTIVALQATADTVECALFTTANKNTVLSLGFHAEPKKDASKNLVMCINSLLTQSYLQLSDISLIAVNRGPSFFTTLRTVIATANGLCLPHGIKRIGISGFDACVAAYGPKEHNQTPVLFLLDACANDVYYVFMISPDTIFSGCAQFSDLCLLIKEKIDTAVFMCLGSGITRYKAALSEFFGSAASCGDEPIISAVPLETVALLAYTVYQKNSNALYNEPIAPLYIKEHRVT